MSEGFTDEQVQQLEAIQTHVLGIFTYTSDQAEHHVADYWEDDKLLLPSVEGHTRFFADCEDFAMVCMRRAMLLGFQARLAVCLDETRTGHCICEVESQDGRAAYYFDNRRKHLSTRQGLIGYTFYSVSPWDPQPGENRPWALVDQTA